LNLQGYSAAVIDGGAELGDGNLSNLFIPAGTSIADMTANFDGQFANLTAEEPATTYLQSFNISDTGIITGVFSDSENRVLGQLSMANFANPDGLNKAGSNTFTPTNNSGAAQIGISGTEGRGGIIPSALEMSNVDLSEEFAEMIVAQRGFQANTRMITTSDEILQELVNLKR
jgi:flagellar hook protein FlgE